MLSFDENAIVIKINKSNNAKAIIITSIVTFILGYTDILIGSELSFSIFYLIPITVAVFLSGKWLGIAFSIICAITWIIADISAGVSVSNKYILIWNTLVRFGYFVFHTVLLSSLIKLIKEVKELSFYDPLTKAANWRFFEEYSNRMLKAAIRDNHKITLAYLDVDNFKQINDKLGHSVGDEVLKTLVVIFKRNIRATDIMARLGGDEFSLLLVNADLKVSKDILDRITEQVKNEVDQRGWDISLSIGAMVFSVIPSTIGPMLRYVDELMYEVKKSGKNNIKLVEQIRA